MRFGFTIMLYKNKKNSRPYLKVNSKSIQKKNYEKFQEMIEESSK